MQFKRDYRKQAYNCSADYNYYKMSIYISISQNVMFNNNMQLSKSYHSRPCLQCFYTADWDVEEHTACKKTDLWASAIVICLEWDANDLHIVQLMPVPPSPAPSPASFKSRMV